MGTNTLPPTQRVPLEEAQTEPMTEDKYGYVRKAYAEVLAAHKDGQGLRIDFPSASASNKAMSTMAYYAEQDGYDLYTRRITKTGTRFFWMGPLTADE